MKIEKQKFLFIFAIAVWAVIGALCVVPVAAEAQALTAEDIQGASEIEISSAEDYIALVDYARTNTLANKSIVLRSDIDLSDITDIAPIGSLTYPFAGTFDGDGKSIALALSGENYVGLFGYIGSDGVVKNLTLSGSLSGTKYVGGIAGYSAGKITDCSVLAEVVGNSYTGGIVGNNAGEITNSINSGFVSGTEYIGGLSGDNSGKIACCINFGKTTGSSYVGGITGRNGGNNASVSACVNAGELACVGSGKYIGGLVGDTSATIKDSYNYAAITASGISIGSAVGNLTAVTATSGNVYNVGTKSAREVVGGSNVTIPSGFSSATEFEMLSGEKLFSDGTLVQPLFDIGYGYLSVPAFFAADKERISALRKNLFSSGEGTESSPFVIDSAEEWVLFENNVAVHDYENKYVKLGRNLTLGAIAPLGKNEEGFVAYNGVFDGDGKKITYSVTTSDSYGALFGKIGPQGRVSDLIAEATVSGAQYSAAIVGELSGELSGISVYGSLSGTEFVGGLAAKALTDAKIISCVNYASVVGTKYVGGMFGYADTVAELSDLCNEGAISAGSGLTYSYFGGIGGGAKEVGRAELLLNKALVSAYKATYVGGVLGYAADFDIDSAFSCGEVIGRNYVGGILGEGANVTINTAGVISKVSGAAYVAGIAGRGAVGINASYFSGSFGTVNEAAIDRTTFRTIAQADATLGSDVFYNSDIILTAATDGTGKSYVELTDGLFVGDGYDGWKCIAKQNAYGTLPIIDSERLYGDNTLMTGKARYDYFGAGTGTEANPYVLSTEQHYQNLVSLSKKYDEYNALDYILGDSITFVRNVAAIGGEDGFCGSFDGAGKGMFAVNFETAMFNKLASGATVKRIALESGVATVASIAATVEAGAVVEDSYSLLSISGNIVGGLVDSNYGILRRSLFFGRISGKTAGGLVGSNGGQIVDCVFGGYVEGKTVGGIAGSNGGDVTGTITNGVINGLDSVYGAGGFFGVLNGSTDTRLADLVMLSRILIKGSEETSGRAAFAGRKSGGASFVSTFYNPYSATDTVAYYDSYDDATDVSYYVRSTTDMLKSEFINNFRTTEFLLGGSRDMDSDYAPINKNLGEHELSRIVELAKQGSAIAIFGRDYLQAAAVGTESNPYLIGTASQLAALSDLSKSYDYDGKYFALSADLDFSGVDFRPIGQYYGVGKENNMPFNGNLDGRYHTIKNMIISLSDGAYAGLFGYGGSHFSVSNVMLSSTCSVTTSGEYAGSIAGYLKGTVNNCISYAMVSGGSIVGGMVAACDNNSAITNSVFAGTVSTSTGNGGYGIIGQNANTVAISSVGSWYLHNNNSGEFVVAGSETYNHNDYGKTLFVDRGGYATVAFEGGEPKFSFFADNSAAKPAVMTAQNNTNSVGESFYPTSFATSDANTKYYLRFTYETGLSFSENSEEGLRSTAYGKGNYYIGQNVKFTLSLKDGYFVSSLGYAATVKNEGDDITLSFSVAVTDGKCELPIKIEAVTEYYSFGTKQNDPVYDGEDKEFLTTAIAGKTSPVTFSPFEYSVYAADGNKVDAPKNAGEYTVVVRLYPEGETGFVGTHKFFVTIAKAAVTVPSVGDDYWTEFASKQYDGNSNGSGLTVAASEVVGIIAADAGVATVVADVRWEKLDIGTTDAVISNFALSGESGDNYYVAGVTEIAVSGATISARSVTLSLSEQSLSGVYNGNKPIFNTYTTDFALNDVTIVWSLQRLSGDEGEDIDEEWASVPQTAKQWNVGRYLVEVTLVDTVAGSCKSDNFDLSTAERYVFVIQPSLVEVVEYTGYNNLVFTGSDLSSSVRGQLESANGGVIAVELRFFAADDEETELDEVLDAGQYIAKPVLTDDNYLLSEQVKALSFSVGKAAAPTLEFSLGSTELVVGGEPAEIVGLGDYYDAKLIVETVATAGATRGRAEIKTVDDKLYLVPVAYPTEGEFTFILKSVDSKNYLDGTSEEKTITVLPGTIYVGVDKDGTEKTYGDVITAKIVYSYDKEQNEIIDDLTTISGFSQPTVVLETIVGQGRYSVSFYGGNSDGYVIATSDYDYINVNKRILSIIVTDDADNSKIYGEETEVITYVINLTDGTKTDTLPNGEKIVLNGQLGRAEGEDVGQYVLNKGTLTDDNNPNFSLQYSIDGRYFKIEKRHVKLVVEQCSKYYGEEDPEFTFRMAEGYSYGNDDDASALRLEITRKEGEIAGSYEYNCTYYDGGKNYFIDGVDYVSNRFYIKQAVPEVMYYASMLGTLRYGDKYSSLRLIGEAKADATAVSGRFVWEDEEGTATDIGTTYIWYKFLPDDNNNYAEVRSCAVTECLPRVAEISFDGDKYYVYSGKVNGGKNIKASVNNALSGDEFSFSYSYSEKDSTNVGDYTVLLTALGNEKYILPEEYAEGYPYTYTIQPATVTVSVESATIRQGDKYTPKINYDGFVSGESVSVLTKKAVVDVPDSPGVFDIVPYGAVADNYKFRYKSAEIVIERDGLADKNVSIEGEFGATFVLTVNEASGLALSEAEKASNKALGHNLFLPNMQRIKGYYALDYSGEAEGEYVYNVALNLSEGDAIYIMYADGSAVKLTDYETADEINDDGTTTITFTSELVSGIAVYEGKSAAEVIKGLVPWMVVAAVVFVAGIVIAIVVYFKHESYKKERKYLSRYDR